MLDNILGSSRGDRRNHAERDALVQRVFAEFEEMPCMRLTGAQARRLFGLQPDVSQRILAGLVQQGALVCDGERYRFNDSRRSPAPHPGGQDWLARLRAS